MSQFVDECSVNLKAGDGGAGAMSFRRESHVPKGGPDGGDGGKGGDVWLVADRNMASLMSFKDKPHRKAGSGTHGKGKNLHGANADDLIVHVPEGTQIRTKDGVLVADLTHHGDRVCAAAGGQGGRGNARFLSNRRRAPSFAEQGEYGEEHWFRLELKLVADAALVGFPNAGKSTLISVISAAKPKIANYPFTTLEPNLGVVRTEDGDEFVVADIPGLIEGAAEGKGLGHRFLRHVERARVLVVLLDMAAMDGTSPAAQLEVLLRELEAYQPELLDRPRVVVRTKADLMPADSIDEELPGALTISAVARVGVTELVRLIAHEVRAARIEAAEDAPEPVVLRPAELGTSVSREDDGTWVVHGRAAARAVALSDLTNDEALAFAQARLTTLGVDRELRRAGVHEGDTVRIGDFEFEYREDALG